MLTLLFSIMMLIIFGKLFIFALKASWGIVKIIFTIVLLPVILIGLVFAGLMYIAVPVLVIIGIVSLVKFCTSK